jgi:anti-sigma regulatory factor (Ser/Thr protein kinase)
MSDLEQRRAEEALPADDSAPRLARDLAAQFISGLDMDRDRSDDLTLIVSELVTNAFVHGRGAQVRLALIASSASVRVEVSDDGTADFDWPGDRIDGHWGLALVKAFSERAGITRAPSTLVWAELDLARTPAATG